MSLVTTTAKCSVKINFGIQYGSLAFGLSFSHDSDKEGLAVGVLIWRFWGGEGGWVKILVGIVIGVVQLARFLKDATLGPW